jgi:hypothetical protein
VYSQDSGYPQDAGYSQDSGYPQNSGYSQGGDFPQANGYSPVSGYHRDDWYSPDDEAPPPAQRDDIGSPGKPKRRRPLRTVILGGAGAVILAAVGLVGYHYLGTSSGVIHPGASLRLPSANPSAESSYFPAKLGKWGHIGSRKLDPIALTANELYPPAFRLPDGSQYARATASLDKECTLAVFGAQLQTALQSGKCTQVVRATYISGDGKIMGTIGVVNLNTAAVAQQAGQVTGADQLIAPLTASRGPAKNLLNGTGVVYAEVKGHYLILMYAEFTNTKKPSTGAQKQQLVAFAQGMFQGSANIALSNRLLYGKPAA